MHIFLAELCLLCFPLYRYENEQPFRKAVEDEINSLYKVIDDANLTKMDLESQIESMKEELTLLSKTHEEVSPGLGRCRANVCLLRVAGIVHWAEQALSSPDGGNFTSGASIKQLLLNSCRRQPAVVWMVLK